MKKHFISILAFLSATFVSAQPKADTIATSAYTLDEVVITGTRNEVDIRHLPMSVSVVKNELIKRRFEPSLLPILNEQIPGLFTTSRGILGYGVSTGAAGGMSMRGVGGSPTTGMLVLIDGHPQYMGLMGHPIADAYQSMISEKIEVVRGPASVLYGSNAMGGVINILTNKMEKDGFKGNGRISYGSFNTATSEASGRIRHKGFSASVSASYNRTDGHRERMGFEQYGGYAKIAYQFSKHWNAFADVNITHFNASNPGMESSPIYDNDSEITRGMASFSLENDYERTSGALKFFYNWGRHQINDGHTKEQKPKDYFFKSKDLMLGVNWYQSASLFKGNRLTVGFDFQMFGGKAWNAFFNDTSTDIADKTENEVAVYIDFRQNISHILTLDAGVRYDHHSATGGHWIPQVGVSIYPVSNGEIKLLASYGFRNPTLRELYMFPPANAELKPENLWNYEISWTHRFMESRLSYGINIFYIKGDNMIQTVKVDGRPLNINTGKIENYGVELSSSYHISDMFNVMANYSFLHIGYSVLAAPKHKLYVGFDFKKERWAASTGIQYVGELYTSLSPIVKEDYVLWNIRGSFRVADWVELFVKGENLLDKRYQVNFGFPMPGATVFGGMNFNF